MYFKLALRNAKRSITDYLIYIMTLIILFSIMLVANFIALIGNIQAGFQTLALPLLITVILLILVNYINKFMLKQRSKEFANYLLLGLERNNLILLVLVEFVVIGIVCFFICILLGFLLTNLIARNQAVNGASSLFLKVVGQTLILFFIMELISLGLLKRSIQRLTIKQLMIEKKRNQPLNKTGQQYGTSILIVSGGCLFLSLIGIVVLPEKFAALLVSLIAIPLFLTVVAFYQFLFGKIANLRKAKTEILYQKDSLYLAAGVTANPRTEIMMNSVFCVCLLFSTMSFIFGTLLFQPQIKIFDINNQRWMGFLQISLGIIFIILSGERYGAN
ncbi:hypothetical protein M2139_001436 [Enterococcus sp. PF1-24]|uniref:FtsX-like permease family protein n=1 Tax=unclassified Enterococcus TaxID=2608891 RepID=UPI00247526E0|nr:MULTISPECIES: FtsX-like permease family protein [unclassified Enterococcus]MDH6364425.1 hypothetical protein [Enterococcus sp. PFB1-1]MDH6401552.1 hypothetical protein [Enterococcus sp. PF1-24]